MSKPDKPNESWELVEQPNDNDSKCDCKRLKKARVSPRILINNKVLYMAYFSSPVACQWPDMYICTHVTLKRNSVTSKIYSSNVIGICLSLQIARF